MVQQHYTQPVMELFLQPRNQADLPAAVNAVLAGELEGSWRLHYFFFLVKLQARWGRIVPRISFRPVRLVTKPPASCNATP